jgi:hypothetical protein
VATYVAATASADSSLTRIAPGAYKLFAWNTVLPGAYQNATFLQPYESQGVGVTVRASSKATVDVRVIHSGK